MGHTCVWDQTNAREGLEEDGAFGGNDDIGGKGQRGTCPCRCTVDGGNYRNRAVGDCADHRHIFVAQRPFEVGICDGGTIPKILPGTKGVACAGDDDGARGASERLCGVKDFGPHLRVERVFDLGPVERDDAVAVLFGNMNALIFHGRPFRRPDSI